MTHFTQSACKMMNPVVFFFYFLNIFMIKASTTRYFQNSVQALNRLVFFSFTGYHFNMEIKTIFFVSSVYVFLFLPLESPCVFLKQTEMSLRLTLYTLLQLSLGMRVPNTKRILFTPCSLTHHVPVFNSKAVCWGSLSPFSPFQHCLLQLIRSSLTTNI